MHRHTYKHTPSHIARLVYGRHMCAQDENKHNHSLHITEYTESTHAMQAVIPGCNAKPQTHLRVRHQYKQQNLCCGWAQDGHTARARRQRRENQRRPTATRPKKTLRETEMRIASRTSTTDTPSRHTTARADTVIIVPTCSGSTTSSSRICT